MTLETVQVDMDYFQQCKVSVCAQSQMGSIDLDTKKSILMSVGG